jgi:hypothetical protein
MYKEHFFISSHPVLPNFARPNEFELISTNPRTTDTQCVNQRYLKNWAEVADKICFGRT